MLDVLQQIPYFQSAAASLYRIQTYLTGGEDLETSVDARSMVSRRGETERLTVGVGTGASKAFELHNASFSADHSLPLLHDISLEIDEGSFTMVIGRVASGKSVILQSLVGEMKMVDGSFKSNGSGTSFCAQSAWLRNASLRKNILGESDFEQSWYDTVTWACGLTQDFKELKDGDATMVGSRGISLSGGQKNRISLARALYARKPILVVDDVLSGLDNNTENLVFSRVFGRDGLLRKANCTAILATHSVRWAPQSDKLVVMSGGRIVGSGPYHELSTKPGFLEAHSLHSCDADLSGHHTDVPEEMTADSKIPAASAETEVESESGYDRRAGDIGSLVYYMNAVGKKHTATFLVLWGLGCAATALQYVWLKELAKASSSPEALRKSIGIFTAITVADIALVAVAVAQFCLVFCPNSSLSTHAHQLAAFMRARYSFLVATDIGSLTNRFSQDIILVDSVLPPAFFMTANSVFEQVARFAIIIAATPPIAVLLPFLAGIGYLIQRVYLRTSRQIRLMDLEAKAPLCTNFLETLAGIATIRAFGWTDAFRARNRQLLDDSQVPFYLLQAIQNWLRLVLELMVAGLVVILVSLAVGLRSRVDPGYLGLALVGAVRLPIPLSLSLPLSR
ncbi:ABC transporter [Neofusicoccum parvum]|nr:ABC transporter [Neofusicoccum parvum]